MPSTGLYYIPRASNSHPSTIPPIVNELRNTLDAEYVGRWFIEHHLLRETQSLLPRGANPSTLNPRYLQILNTTTHPRETFVGITPMTDDSHPPQQAPKQSTADSSSPHHVQPLITTIPSGRDAEDFLTLTLRLPQNLRMPQSWVMRQTLSLMNGTVWSLPDFRVRVGELRHTQTGIIKGTLVQIEWDDKIEANDRGSSSSSTHGASGGDSNDKAAAANAAGGAGEIEMKNQEDATPPKPTTTGSDEDDDSETDDIYPLTTLFGILTSHLPANTNTSTNNATSTAAANPQNTTRHLFKSGWRAGSGVAGGRERRIEERWEAKKIFVDEAVKEEEMRLFLEVLKWPATGRYG